MIRRIIEAVEDPKKIDDKDYYGNKRLELAGDLMSLLFEDTFKILVSNLQKEINSHLSNKRQKNPYDASLAFTNNINYVTNALENTLSTGNFNLKRFKLERAGVT
jgi:DNA-directed RNA polymerase III subunit RPC2